MFILCHKCGGVLSHTEDTPAEHREQLGGCVCISGWVRGFEPHLDFPAAVTAQIQAAESRIKLYADQGRPMAPDSYEYKHIKHLMAILANLAAEDEAKHDCLENYK